MFDRPFIFKAYSFAAESGLLRLQYGFEGGNEFTEEIQFSGRTENLSQSQQLALDHVFRLIFLLAGVSYYKAFAPTELRCEAFVLDPITAKFIEKVYRCGLAEFAFRNGLDLTDRIRIISEECAPPLPTDLPKSGRVLVPIGGGKDSIVTIECLRAGRLAPTLFVLSSSESLPAALRHTIEVSGLPAIIAVRRISPELIRLNSTGVYNGHVPITSIVSAVAVASALIHGLDTIVMSNESSANDPNTIYLGQPVNHQYSKSLEFEKDLSSYLREHVSPSIEYFSLLRPLSEIEISRRFSRFDRYHEIFRSCNSAFKQEVSERMTHWCCNCPKCRFVFLALAPFIEKERLVKIFGVNLLDQAVQEQGYAELCGLTDVKPFECVGEAGESVSVFRKLAEMEEWRADTVIAKLSKKLVVGRTSPDDELATYLSRRAESQVPPLFLEMLDAGD